MLVRLTPKYKFICDRCGKVQLADANNNIYDTWTVTFVVEDIIRKNFIKSGDICEDCRKDFVEIAENFFDEVNREKQNKDERGVKTYR